jgi:hypothetical protein
VSGGYRNAQNGDGRLGRQHPREMGSSSSTRDDTAKSACRGILGVPIEQIRSPVRRHHSCLVRYAKLGQPPGSVLHDLPIGVAAHHESHEGLSHGVLPKRSFGGI